MKVWFLIWLVFCILLSFSFPAYAYLDPGSGSMVLQAVLAGIAGLMVLLRYFWNRIARLFGIERKKEE